MKTVYEAAHIAELTGKLVAQMIELAENNPDLEDDIKPVKANAQVLASFILPLAVERMEKGA